VAALLVVGGMPFDVFDVVSRDKEKWTFCRGAPTSKQLVEHIGSSHRAHAEAMQRSRQAGEGSFVMPRLRTYTHAERQPWHPQFLVEALRASRRLKALDKVGLVVSEITQLAFPSKAEALRVELRLTGLQSPSRFVLARARVQLDAVMMLARREANARAGIFRQLMFDASPRKGIELFACREIVTVRGDVRGSQTRTLPSTSLEVGHFSLEDKT
jgi:hypothetical protein